MLTKIARGEFLLTRVLAVLAAAIGVAALGQERAALGQDRAAPTATEPAAAAGGSRAATAGQNSATASGPATSVTAARIDLRVSRLVDMHYTLRHFAELPDEKRPAELRAAADVVGEIEKTLGGAMAWGILEAALVEAADVAAARQIAEMLPTEFQSMSGAKLPLRELATRLMAAYEPIEGRFVERIWPEHEKTLRAARGKLDSSLLPQAARCLEYIERSFGMENAQATIPVYLVAAAPTPGGFTHRRRGGGGVCFVGVDERPELLNETVLHECVHALDLSTQSQATALNTLRKELQAAGLGPRSEMMRSVPHTLMFVQAGETVRRLLNPEHKHYGDAAGYYAKVPEAVAAVREPWTAFLDEKLSREAAIAKIVERTPKGAK
jgi:hypothetical protein